MRIYRIAASKIWWEDSRGQVMWIKGDTANSALSWREMQEAITMKDQTIGSVSGKRKDGSEFEFSAPFTKRTSE